MTLRAQTGYVDPRSPLGLPHGEKREPVKTSLAVIPAMYRRSYRPYGGCLPQSYVRGGIQSA
jgi:hypothetical protein